MSVIGRIACSVSRAGGEDLLKIIPCCLVFKRRGNKAFPAVLYQ